MGQVDAKGSVTFGDAELVGRKAYVSNWGGRRPGAVAPGGVGRVE